jgi:hypothetical protein
MGESLFGTVRCGTVLCGTAPSGTVPSGTVISASLTLFHSGTIIQMSIDIERVREKELN